MDSHLRFFILLVPIFVTILKTDAFNNDRVFLVSPKQRDSSRNNTCMIPTEKSNVTCCVCPDSCELTYPRKPTKIYSMGIKVFRFYFSMRGPVNTNILKIHLYICVRNSTSDIISQECLQKNPLRIIQIIKNNNLLKVDAEAPPNLTCHHCLIQWAITKDIPPMTNSLIKQYFGCLDIAILSANDHVFRSHDMLEFGSGTDDSKTSTLSTSIASTQSPFQTSHEMTTPHSTTITLCWAVGEYAKVAGMTNWCYFNCMRGYCPSTHCQCVSNPTTTLSSSTSKWLTTTVLTTPKSGCQGTGAYANVKGMDEWCQINCLKGYCPESHCKCTPEAHTTRVVQKKNCKAIGIMALVPGMHKWCMLNCKPNNYCPESHCKCSFNAETTRPYQNVSTTTSNIFSTRLINPTRVSIKSSLKPLKNTTSLQSSVISTTLTNNNIANTLSTETKRMSLSAASSTNAVPSSYTASAKFPTTISQRKNTTTLSSSLIPIALKFSTSGTASTTIFSPTNSTTVVSGATTSPSTVSSTTTSTVKTTTTQVTTITLKICKATGYYAGVAGMDRWCDINCNKGYCPKAQCQCNTQGSTTASKCRAKHPYDKLPNMHKWCEVNCANNYCPPSHCQC